MSTAPGPAADVVEAKLRDATAGLAEQIREAHAATKELRLAIREAGKVITEIREATSQPLNDHLEEQCASMIRSMGQAVERAQDRAVDQVAAEFGKLERLFTQGRDGGPSLEAMIEERRVIEEAWIRANGGFVPESPRLPDLRVGR